MKNIIAVAFLLVASTASAQNASNIAGVRTFVAPEYPVVARAARIQGEVRLRVAVEASGRVTRVESSSGPGILVKYAKANVIHMSYTPIASDSQVEVVYTFRLRPPEMETTPVPVVELASPFHVIITSNLPKVTGYDEGLKRQ